eukprot:g17128.t1
MRVSVEGDWSGLRDRKTRRAFKPSAWGMQVYRDWTCMVKMRCWGPGTWKFWRRWRAWVVSRRRNTAHRQHRRNSAHADATPPTTNVDATLPTTDVNATLPTDANVTPPTTDVAPPIVSTASSSRGDSSTQPCRVFTITPDLPLTEDG